LLWIGSDVTVFVTSPLKGPKNYWLLQILVLALAFYYSFHQLSTYEITPNSENSRTAIVFGVVGEVTNERTLKFAIANASFILFPSSKFPLKEILALLPR
jgi:hypothetical protein